jgi:hypothetical protein
VAGRVGFSEVVYRLFTLANGSVCQGDEPVGQVLTHTSQPKHLVLSNITLPFSSRLALNWHLVTHLPQFVHVSGLRSAKNLLTTTASSIPNLTSARAGPEN